MKQRFAGLIENDGNRLSVISLGNLTRLVRRLPSNPQRLIEVSDQFWHTALTIRQRPASI